MSSGGARPMKSREAALMSAVLGVQFPGRTALVDQLEHAVVRTLDQDGSIEFIVDGLKPALVERRIPIEAQWTDTDGAPVHALLHVVNGLLSELEIYREDGANVLSIPDPECIDVILY